MFVAIIGTRCSGKVTVQRFLVSKGFQRVQLVSHPQEQDGRVTPDGSSSIPGEGQTPSGHDLQFYSLSDLLTFVTKNWLSNYVTVDLCTRDAIGAFIKRPFFMLVSVDAPMLDRFQRSKTRYLSLENFVQEDDDLVFGNGQNISFSSSLNSLSELVNVRIVNNFESTLDLYAYLEQLNLLDPRHLRPGWDAYFMTLASLASRRSNCMKRRVGAVLVRDNRILATGYNGTPRGVKNCNEGGCFHCNSGSSNQMPYECVCLHAEENALLEAGRERVGKGAVLYCNTCPCLKCTIKIIQTGVEKVVYNLSYKVDDASAALFQQAGVEIRKYDPNQGLHLPSGNADQQEAFALPGITVSQ